MTKKPSMTVNRTSRQYVSLLSILNFLECGNSYQFSLFSTFLCVAILSLLSILNINECGNDF